MTIHRVSTVKQSKRKNNKTDKFEDVLVPDKNKGASRSLARAIKFANQQNCDTIIS